MDGRHEARHPNEVAAHRLDEGLEVARRRDDVERGGGRRCGGDGE
jgi:hypothetical protein